jgi:hypothetical protein
MTGHDPQRSSGKCKENARTPRFGNFQIQPPERPLSSHGPARRPKEPHLREVDVYTGPVTDSTQGRVTPIITYVRNDIVEKLKPVVVQPIETEERVVYLMVEIRKLIEHSRLPDNQFLTLRFFCNWAVHTKLTRGEGAEIVGLMNKCFEGRLNGQYMPEEEHERLHGIFSFEAFRNELLEFLRGQGLTLSAMELPPQLINFIKLYSSVVADCPIIYTKKDLRLRWMDRAVISTYQVDHDLIPQIRQESPFAECPFGLRWTILRDEREVMKWEIPIIF